MRYSRDLRARQPCGRRTLTQRALAILARYGSAANLYLPGIGAINGITAGNWLDSAGTVAATVDDPVGLVQNGVSTNHAIQATTASKPILRRGLVNKLRWSGDFRNAAWAKNGGTTANATTISLPNTNEAIYQEIAMPATVGTAATSAAVLSGSGTISIGLARMGSGAYEQTIQTVTLSATPTLVVVTHTIINTGQAGFILFITRIPGNTATTVTFNGAAVYQGTVTAQQIIADGGIPLTTTAPASSTLGSYRWQFDGSNDGLVLSQPVFTASNDDGFVCAGVTPNSVAGVQTVVASRGPIATPTNCANGLFITSGVPFAYWEGGVATTLTGSAVTVGIPLVISARKVGTAVSLRVNGTVAQSGTTSVNNATIANSAIGISLSGASNAPLLPGSHQIAAAVMCKGVVSEADAKLIERFVGSLSGVAL